VYSHQLLTYRILSESHCISEWGPSFRPDYLKVARFAVEVRAGRVLALTATATPSVSVDICKGFGIDMEKGVFQTGNYRPKYVPFLPSSTSTDHSLLPVSRS
jgi:superfamily II DNA helicase RecQ